MKTFLIAVLIGLALRASSQSIEPGTSCKPVLRMSPCTAKTSSVNATQCEKFGITRKTNDTVYIDLRLSKPSDHGDDTLTGLQDTIWIRTGNRLTDRLPRDIRFLCCKHTGCKASLISSDPGTMMRKFRRRVPEGLIAVFTCCDTVRNSDGRVAIIDECKQYSGPKTSH